LLLPVFEFPRTTLSAGESDEFAMRIHTNKTTALTEYLVPVFARSNDYYVERDISFELIECEFDAFDLRVSPAELRIDKGNDDYFTVKVKSVIDEDQTVRLSVESPLPATLESYEVFLPAYSEVTQELQVEPRYSDDEATYRIKVHAWNSREREEEIVKVKVMPEHDLEIEIRNNDFDARICSATEGQIFEVIIRNNGDYDETVELEIDNDYEFIQALVSEDEIEVAEGTEKVVYVFVNPSYNAELGEHIIFIDIESDYQEFREELRFTVIESEFLQKDVIEIISYPTDVEIMPGQDKILSFTIRNPTTEDIENVKITIFGTGNGVSIFPISIGTLEANEKVTVT
ncbi:MAG: hypothetical protein KAS30_04110, partial [Candidatus Diapherotrites archaeon]|nr:hypothetical protein [Candidatus Diapherotrites archaeon]